MGYHEKEGKKELIKEPKSSTEAEGWDPVSRCQRDASVSEPRRLWLMPAAPLPSGRAVQSRDAESRGGQPRPRPRRPSRHEAWRLGGPRL